MPYLGADRAHLKGSFRILPLLFISIFATELAVMEIISSFYARLGMVASALLDATLLTLLLALPFSYFFFRLRPDTGSETKRTPSWLLFLKALSFVFLVEYLVMLLLPGLLNLVDFFSASLVDAFTSAACLTLVTWYLGFRSGVGTRNLQLLEFPLRLYALLLCAVFFADLLQEFFFAAPQGGKISPADRVVDALITTICGAPVLYFLVVRPLRHSARSARSRIAAMYAQVIDAIVVVDRSGTICSFNPAAERIFGYAAADLIGIPAAILLEEGEERLQALMAGASPSGEGAPASFEGFNFRRRDGGTLVMELSISEVRLDSRVEYLLIMRDVTSRNAMAAALRDSEARFREIFHQSEDAIVFFRPGTTAVLDANAKAESMFGFSTAELAAGGVALVVPPATLPEVEAAITGISEERCVIESFQCRHRSGEELIISLRGRIILLQGEPVSCCTLRDISERMRIQEKSREIQAKLIQANKMTSLGLLVSAVAHEINNPNNFIMANAELLSRISADMIKALNEYSAGEQEREQIYLAGIPFAEVGHHTARLIRGITDGSRRVNGIVNNLKDFAREERRQEMREVDVNQVARSALSLLHHELIKYTDRFHFEPDELLPPVRGYGQQLGQVIVNLLLNSCQALPSRDRGIWLTTSREREGTVIISVRDEGRGIPPQESRRVLEPFYSTKLDQGGTGLGLSISDSIVKEHGGRLEFSSLEGSGTTFWIRLPAADSTGSAASAGCAGSA